MSEQATTDGGQYTRAYIVRLELNDEPGELLSALGPIAENGGNLLSIFHERGSITPRGRIPVEVDFEATEERFETIVAELRANGVNVTQAGPERYGEEMNIVLIGHLVETDLSDTLTRLEECTSASVADVSLTAPNGTDEVSCARVRLATQRGKAHHVLDVVRELAAEKGLEIVEPLLDGGDQ